MCDCFITLQPTLIKVLPGSLTHPTVYLRPPSTYFRPSFYFISFWQFTLFLIVLLLEYAK